MSFVDNTTGGRVVLEGICPFKITLDDTCEVGDLIGYDALSSTAWERADVANKVFATCIAGEKCETSGDEITVYKEAVIDLGTGCTATAGDLVYAGGTAGQYAAEPAGSWQQAVAMMTTAQIMYVRPTAMPLVVYTLTGVGYAGFFRCEVDADEETPEGHFGGIRIDVKTIASTAAISSDCYGLYVFFQLLEDTTGTTAMIRLEDGCANGCGPYSFFTLIANGADGGPEVLFYLVGPEAPTSGCWDVNTTAATACGHIHIDRGGVDYYLMLYSATS